MTWIRMPTLLLTSHVWVGNVLIGSVFSLPIYKKGKKEGVIIIVPAPGIVTGKASGTILAQSQHPVNVSWLSKFSDQHKWYFLRLTFLMASLEPAQSLGTRERCGQTAKVKIPSLSVTSMWPGANSSTFQRLHFLSYKFWLVTIGHTVIVRIKCVKTCQTLRSIPKEGTQSVALLFRLEPWVYRRTGFRYLSVSKYR